MLILPAGTPTKEDTVAKYKLTAVVNTAALDLDHLVDSNNAAKVAEYLQYDSGDLPIGEAMSNIKLERIPDDG